MTYVSDGASIPSFLRKIINKTYPSWVIDVIDVCGIEHDWDVDNGMDVYQARQEFDINLYEGGLRDSFKLSLLRRVLVLGLAIYDNSPSFIKKLMERSTNKKDNQETVEGYTVTEEDTEFKL